MSTVGNPNPIIVLYIVQKAHAQDTREHAQLWLDTLSEHDTWKPSWTQALVDDAIEYIGNHT